MFEQILESINNNTDAVVGSTGYIDGVHVKAPSKGVDQYGRPFFSLPLVQSVRTEGETFDDEYSYIGTVTFFQRYTDRSDVWVIGGQTDGLVCGGITPKVEQFVAPVLEAVLAGKTLKVEIPAEMHGWKRKVVTISLANLDS